VCVESRYFKSVEIERKKRKLEGELGAMLLKISTANFP
jgi:hypothetical protein